MLGYDSGSDNASVKSQLVRAASALWIQAQEPFQTLFSPWPMQTSMPVKASASTRKHQPSSSIPHSQHSFSLPATPSQPSSNGSTDSSPPLPTSQPHQLHPTRSTPYYSTAPPKVPAPGSRPMPVTARSRSYTMTSIRPTAAIYPASSAATCPTLSFV